VQAVESVGGSSSIRRYPDDPLPAPPERARRRSLSSSSRAPYPARRRPIPAPPSWRRASD